MKKTLIYTAIVLVVFALALTTYAYTIVSTGFDINKNVYIYVDSNRSYAKVLDQVRDSAKVRNLSNFEQLSKLMKYNSHIKTGRYKVEPQMNIWDLLKDLRSGNQTPVRLKFNNVRTTNDLATRISGQLMFDSHSLLAVLNSPEACTQLGFTPQTVASMFIPDTYEIYWDTDVNSFLNRMKKEYSKFWNSEHLAKAQSIKLAPIEVSVLASIVEEECMYADEYPMVAGLYLNRIHRGQLLQADPTVKFAIGDFGLRRILYKHLEFDSPYNTYKYPGLPPGPIRIPSIKGLESVLNYKEHGYLYMCAKEDFSGRHNFAVSLAEHERNASKYRKALDNRKIYQ